MKRSIKWALASGAFGALGLAGCALVLGIEDVPVSVLDGSAPDAGVGDGGAADTAAPPPPPPPPPPVDSAIDAGTCWTRPFGTAVNVAELNSAADELNVRLSRDERTAYLASNRPDGGIGGVDLYTSVRTFSREPFADPILHALSTPADDTHPSLSSDGLSLYFSSTRAEAGADLYVATRNVTTVPFSSFATRLSSLSTSPFDDSFPWIAYDELLFASNRAGDIQLYRAGRDGGGFGVPTPVIEVHENNTVSNCPVLSVDGTWLYFASTRTAGGAKGESDIWVAHRASADGPFDPPTNVKELNTASSDRPAWLSDDGCRMYLTSTREGGRGGLDVWLAER